MIIVCARRHHTVGRVLDDGGQLAVEVTRFAAGRRRRDWVAGRFVLAEGNGRRYGCGCGGPGWLVMDSELLGAAEGGAPEFVLK